MGNRSLLIVDDEDMVRSALKRALRGEDYTIYTASSPEEGLALLKQHDIDVVMSDHLMPTMTGLDFLKLVRDRHPHVCRIMLTGQADMEMAIKAINQGEIYRFLQKPWDNVELKVTLHLAFERMELEQENRRLLSALRRQSTFIKELEGTFPGIASVARDAQGAILLSETELQLLEHCA